MTNPVDYMASYPHAHESHSWIETQAQPRCERCGAYSNLSSGLFPCSGPRTQDTEEGEQAFSTSDVKSPLPVEGSQSLSERFDPSDYQNLAQRTEVDQESVLRRLCGLCEDGTSVMSLNHAAIGLAGEAGEVAGIVEKYIWYGKNLNKVDLVDEIGDCMWYLAQICNAFGLDMTAIMQANIAKLRQRYSEKFSGEQWSNRDKEAEKTVVKNTVE